MSGSMCSCGSYGRKSRSTFFLLLLKASLKMGMGNKLKQVWMYNADLIKVWVPLRWLTVGDVHSTARAAAVRSFGLCTKGFDQNCSFSSNNADFMLRCGKSLLWSGVPPSHRNNPSAVIPHFCDNVLEHPLVFVSSDNDDDDEESEHNLGKCMYVFMRNIHFASLLPASLSPFRSQHRSDEWGMRCFWFITEDNIWEVSRILFTDKLQLLIRVWFQGMKQQLQRQKMGAWGREILCICLAFPL